LRWWPAGTGTRRFRNIKKQIRNIGNDHIRDHQKPGEHPVFFRNVILRDEDIIIDVEKYQQQ